jgi:hypothetical protein
MEQPIPDIKSYRPDLPDGVANAILRALDRNPNNRFDTARQFGAAVLDGFGGVRPWTQGEMSDFVRHNFASEIHKRVEQVSAVVQRTHGGQLGRATMPMLTMANEGEHETDDDDDGFPSVETEVDGKPPWMQRPTPVPPSMHASNSADFAASTGSGTPPPFGAETTGTGSMPSLQPLRGPVGMPSLNSTGSVVVLKEKRSIVWPLIAVAMVAVTAGALVLVWKQMQQQKPAEIKITQESVARPVGEGDSSGSSVTMTQTGSGGVTHMVGSAEPAGSDDAAGSDKGSAPDKNPDDGKNVVKKPRARTYDAAVLEKKGELLTCFNAHPDAIPKEQIFAQVSIKASGKAYAVELTPPSLQSSPLGMCLRNVLTSAAYPGAPSDNSIKIPLTANRR